MALQIGIVGLPNVGKSTLFNALALAHAAVAAYPFTTIDPNVGVAIVPDDRLRRIADRIHPERIVPAGVELVDIAGLVQGASRGEGLGNQFLGHIRNVDAILMVVRCFADPNVPHVAGDVDPIRDIEILDTELALADLATAKRYLQRLQHESKGRPKEFEAAIALAEQTIEALEEGVPASSLQPTEAAASTFREMNLLTAKPRLLLANVNESGLATRGPAAEVIAYAEAHGAQAIVLCAAMEAELAGWPPDEAADYRRGLGVLESGLAALARAAYRLLGLITFFTTTGGKEVRAWPIPGGISVLAAAGKIHTEMERGFVRAEVISFPDLERAGTMAEARARGLIRLEGREYVVRDGDIIHIRFAV